jgi:glycine cleavage system pyridoxal-binding protein P
MKFSNRHIGPTFDEQRKMLNEIGVSSIQELVDQTPD